MNYGTLPTRFLNAVEEHPSPRAQMFRGPDRWESISSQEFLRRVQPGSPNAEMITPSQPSLCAAQASRTA